MTRITFQEDHQRQWHLRRLIIIHHTILINSFMAEEGHGVALIVRRFRLRRTLMITVITDIHHLTRRILSIPPAEVTTAIRTKITMIDLPTKTMSIC